MSPGCLSICCHSLFGTLYFQCTRSGNLTTSAGATLGRLRARRPRKQDWSTRASLTAARSQCAGGMILKQVRCTTSCVDVATDIGHQQSGDLKRQTADGRSNRRRQEGGRSISRDTTSSIITDFAMWRRSKGNHCIPCAMNLKNCILYYLASYCIAGVVGSALTCLMDPRR